MTSRSSARGTSASPTAACFAHLGHDVVCADLDETRVRALSKGEVPILEEGLPALVAEGLASGRLQFVVGAPEAAAGAEFVFLCVQTPQSESGAADLSIVEAVAREIAPVLRPGTVVVNKSTMPVGSTDARGARAQVGRCGHRRRRRIEPGVPPRGHKRCATSSHRDRIVIGCDDTAVAVRVSELYRDVQAPILVTDPASAEMIKYASNAFLATKISFVNAIANLCEAVERRRARSRARDGLRPAHRVRVPAPRSRLRRLVLPEGHRRAPAHGRRGGLRLRPAARRDRRQRPAARAHRRQDPRRGGRHRWTARTWACGGSRSRPTPTTCAIRPRWSSSSGCSTKARGVRAYDPAAGERPRRALPGLDVVHRSVRGGRRCAGPRAAHRVGRVPLARLRAGARRRWRAPTPSSTPATCSTRRRCAGAASRTRASAADAARRRHRRRRVPRLAPLPRAARARLGGRRGRQLLTGRRRQRRRPRSTTPASARRARRHRTASRSTGPVDAVLHFASPASPPEYLARPIETLEVGSIGTRHALDLAREHDGARFLLASTSEVYGDPDSCTRSPRATAAT